MAGRAAREEERVFVVEGPRALRDALDARAPVRDVFVAAVTGASPDLVERASAAGAAVHRLEPHVLERVASTVSPQPVLGVVEQVDVELASLSGARLLVVVVDLRDPGNLGTVLRSAAAAGADGVVCCGSHVDIYNPKTVRAAAGSLFHLPVVSAGDDAVAVLDRIGGWGMRRVAAVVQGGRDYTETDVGRPVALVIGGEAAGLPATVRAATDEAVTIPMAGSTESLNVAMAAAVLCFEFARRRRMTIPGG